MERICCGYNLFRHEREGRNLSRLIDLKGKRFGRLEVIEKMPNNKNSTIWKCRCDCGRVTTPDSYSLRSGRAKSCGCLGREKAHQANTTHGGTHTKLYNIWTGMKKRCDNENYEHYNKYGGKGIQVCDEWKDDFKAFREWSYKNGYRKDLEIERINNDGDYKPSNCTWATRTEQVRNRSNSVNITYKRKTLPLIEWCRIYDVRYKLAHARYKKGWSFERIFNLTYRDRGKLIDRQNELIGKTE